MADSYKSFDKESIVSKITFTGYSYRKRDIVFGCVLVLSLLVCIVLACLLATRGGRDDGVGAELPPQNTKECKTSVCFRSIAYVMYNLNTSVNPCNNFFKYACGTWAENNPLNPDISDLTPRLNILYNNEQKLRRLMEISTPVGDAERKLKDFFFSCTDAFGRTTQQGLPFLQQVVDKAGGWYLIDTLKQAHWDLQTALQAVHVDFWTDAFFTFSLRTDWLDWTKTSVQIDLSGTGLSWIYYVRPDAAAYIADYKKFMRTVAGYLLRDSGVQLNKTEADRRIDVFVDDVYKVEFALANITQFSDPTEDPHAHENRISLKQLNTMTHGLIDWVSFFTYMFDSDLVNANTKMIVLEVDYLAKMGLFVKNLGENKNRILNNYMTWRLAHKYVQDLSWDYIHANRQFYVDMTGEAEFLGTWRYCMGLMDRDMGEALSSLFVKDHFSDANKKKSEEIVDELKLALEDSIMNNQWMDDVTRNLAEQKIKKSFYKMGYPDFMIRDDKLDAVYKELSINRNDYFGNRLNMNKFYKSDWNRRLRKGTDVEEWTYNTYSVIAEYYNPWRELIVPAGLLQWPLYDHKLPHYMNFGALGTILGHNLVHAIDRIGSQYKLDGSQFGQWWSNRTIKEYETVRDCIINTYVNKTMGPFQTTFGPPDTTTIPVDAKGYAPEALAETSGVRLAYKAFKRWESKNKKERSAPGLSHTNDQMFFISYAQSNCFNRNGNEAFSQAARGIVQENLKVNMALSQVKEFRDAFKCPAKSKMVAPKLCNMY